MSKTYELLRKAEASYQDNIRNRDRNENFEKCLGKLELSYNQIISQNFDSLMNSYFQINTIIAEPNKFLKLLKDNQANDGFSDFLTQRRLQIIERIEKILKRHAFIKINELILKIEDKNIQDKINQEIKQLEFLIYNKRSDWIDRLSFEQFTANMGSNQTVQSKPPHSSLEKSDSDQKENISVSSIFSRIIHLIKK